MSATTFSLATFFLIVAGALFGLVVLRNSYVALILGLAAGSAPYFLLKISEASQARRMDEQLPEALDLMARALRAGHALGTAIEMVAQEMSDPIRSEFAALDEELRFGLSMREALSNLCTRVDAKDLRFFAVAVVLHKETGGNLAEVLDKISKLMRDRLQFRRQVRSLTAEGRFSAVVMLCLPFALALYLYWANPTYLSALWIEETGRFMIGAALTLQILGYFVIRKIVEVEM
jgi:tight adherence protein B